MGDHRRFGLLDCLGVALLCWLSYSLAKSFPDFPLPSAFPTQIQEARDE